MIACRHDFVGVGGAAPAFLRKRQIHANDHDFDVRQFTRLVVEPFSFRSHTVVSRRHGGD